MSLLQVKIDDNLNNAIKEKAKKYGVPVTSLIKIVLVKSFLGENNAERPGNVFNADRDNNGGGVSIDNLIDLL